MDVLLTLIVEPVYSVDTRALVVASKDEEVLRVFDLVMGGEISQSCDRKTFGQTVYPPTL